jgi:hypothetical protein
VSLFPPKFTGELLRGSDERSSVVPKGTTDIRASADLAPRDGVLPSVALWLPPTRASGSDLVCLWGQSRLLHHDPA